MTRDAYEQPRPLTEREREILDFLLSVNVRGIEELRDQGATAQAVRLGSPIASFALHVDREATRPTPLRARPFISAWTKERDGPELYELLLWVDGEGWLSAVEFVPMPWYADEREHERYLELLPASKFEPPTPLPYGLLPAEPRKARGALARLWDALTGGGRD